MQGQSAAQHSTLKAKCSGAQGTLGLLFQRVGGNYRRRIEHPCDWWLHGVQMWVWDWKEGDLGPLEGKVDLMA